MAIKKNLREAPHGGTTGAAPFKLGGSPDTYGDGMNITHDSIPRNESNFIPKTTLVEKIFYKLGITQSGLIVLKQKISDMLGNLGGLMQKGFEAVVTFLTKAINMVSTVMTYVKDWIGVNLPQKVGSYSLGFWVFWAVAGSILAVATVKIIKWLRSKFKDEAYGYKILMNTELIKNESLILKEAADEPGFVTKKVLSAGVNAVQELKAVEKELAAKPTSSAKTFMQKFGKWILWVAAGALVVLAGIGFYKNPAILSNIASWFKGADVAKSFDASADAKKLQMDTNIPNPDGMNPQEDRNFFQQLFGDSRSVVDK
jgi:hypothetical protein